LQPVAVEKAEQPAVEHQVLVKTAGARFGQSGKSGGFGGSASHNLYFLPGEHAGDEFGLDLAKGELAGDAALGLGGLGDGGDVVVAVDIDDVVFVVVGA
jgi:hypothetical protein